MEIRQLIDDLPDVIAQTDQTAAHAGPARREIIYLINVDWFFVSHFLHIARRAQAAGHHVTVLTRLERTETRLSEYGFTVVDLPAERAGQGLRGLRRTISVVRRVLGERPDAVVHAFGAFGMVVGALAMGRKLRRPAIFTITGRGYLAADTALLGNVKRSGLATFVRRVADAPSVMWIAENGADAAALGLTSADAQRRTIVVPGAGVDIARFQRFPLPAMPPLKCIIVARAIWSKGIDVAVDAIQEARFRGCDCTLTIVGAPDPNNPRSLAEATLAVFSVQPGIRWLRYRDDVPDLLAQHHVVLLPSRGGEGTPKSLLEAAAAGRMIITTDVPGCLELARETGGRVVGINDAKAIADVLCSLSIADIEAAGASARQVAVTRYDEAAIWAAIAPLYAGDVVTRTG